MTNEEILKDQFLKIWETNPIFRDNIAFLTQVSLRNFPTQIINESLKRMDDFFRYDLSNDFLPPPLPAPHLEQRRYARFTFGKSKKFLSIW